LIAVRNFGFPLLGGTKFILQGEFKRGEAPLFNILPPLLPKERGIKGVRLIDISSYPS